MWKPQVTWRLYAVLGGMVVLVMASLLVLWFSLDASRLRARNLSAVRIGMERREVETLLGGPPGDYGSFREGVHDYGDGSMVQLLAGPTTGPVTVENWLDDHNRISVFFDQARRVVAVSKASYFRRSAKGGVLEFVLVHLGRSRPRSPAPPQP